MVFYLEDWKSIRKGRQWNDFRKTAGNCNRHLKKSRHHARQEALKGAGPCLTVAINRL
jgi:hypothetical protein